jgi:S1-C subfamily serine protease
MVCRYRNERAVPRTDGGARPISPRNLPVMKRVPVIAAACLVVGMALGGWIATHPDSLDPWHSASAQTASAPTSTVASSTLGTRPAAMPLGFTPDEQRNIRVYESANRSVVNIDTTIIQVDAFWGLQREAEGSGSGAILDRQGHIVTNYHVIDGAQASGRIAVTLASNKTYPARLIGGDKEFDIAILKIDAPADELVPVPLGASNKLRVGQRVYAVGNPFGWDGTMTTGIISSLNRNLPSRVRGRDMKALIQTDAAMNPGNSGGPLLNTNAEMIGMCVAIASRTGQNSGVGFAIPIDRIRAVLPDLIAHGKVVRADIGISEVMETSSGLVLGRLTPGGPADQAGLKGFEVLVRRDRGFVETSIDRSHADRIVAADGEPMTTGVQFQDKIWEHRPGDVIKLTIIRDGKEMEVSVTLAGA